MFDLVFGLAKRVVWPVLAVAGLTAGYVGYETAVDTQSGVSVSQAQELKAKGSTMLIQGLNAWSPCSQPAKPTFARYTNLQNAQTAGLKTAAYFLVDSHTSGREAVDRAIAGMPVGVWDHLEWLAIDFEIPDECYAVGYRVPVEVIYEAANYLNSLGKQAVVYTSCNEWRNHLFPSNPLKPSNTLLWNASWDNDPDIDYPRCGTSTSGYGSWTLDELIAEQWSGAVIMAGVSVDQNTLVVREPPVPPVITPPSCSPCLVAPPSYAPECWTEVVDARYGNRWNLCHQSGGAWVFPDLSFYLPSNNTHYHANGVPKS